MKDVQHWNTENVHSYDLIYMYKVSRGKRDWIGETWSLMTWEPQAQCPLLAGTSEQVAVNRVTQSPKDCGTQRPGFGSGRVWEGKKYWHVYTQNDPDPCPHCSLWPGSENSGVHSGKEDKKGKRTKQRRMEWEQQHGTWGNNRKKVRVPVGTLPTSRIREPITEPGGLTPPLPPTA